MLVVMRKDADDTARESLKAYLIDRGFDIHQSTGANRVIIGVIGDTQRLATADIEGLPGVLQVVRIVKEG